MPELESGANMKLQIANVPCVTRSHDGCKLLQNTSSARRDPRKSAMDPKPSRHRNGSLVIRTSSGAF